MSNALQLPELSSQHAHAYARYNVNLQIHAAITSGLVKDQDLATPPGSPAESDVYIVAASPTGAWATYAAKSLAVYAAGDWHNVPAVGGMFVYVLDEDMTYYFNSTSGNWETIIGSGGDVVGPASATDSVPALFDGTTGKLLKNSTPTGTGDPVLANSPTLVTPNLGTPSAANLANATGLPIAGGGTGASTAQAARLALLPAIAAKALYMLRVNAGESDYELFELPTETMFDLVALSTFPALGDYLAVWDSSDTTDTPDGTEKKILRSTLCLRPHKFDATAAPTTTDDSAAGWEVGSLWVDVTNDKAYVCLDDTATAAVWTEITQAGGSSILDKLDATAAPTATDDSGSGYAVGSMWVDITNDRAYICVDATATAAVWKECSVPLTTNGDLLYWNSGAMQRLPIGTAGQRLQVSGGLPAWQTPATLAVADGGTGATTAAGARTNILPSQSGNGLKTLRVNSGASDVEYADRWTMKKKTADSVKTSDATLADDTHLSGIALPSGVSVLVKATLFYKVASGNPDFQCALNFSGTTTTDEAVFGQYMIAAAGGNGFFGAATFDAVRNNFDAAAGVGCVIMYAHFTTTSTGNLSLQWAQRTSHADATTLLAASTLEYVYA